MTQPTVGELTPEGVVAGTWLLNEDAAVKRRTEGIRVVDAAAPSGRPVGTWFRQPEGELAAQRFPFITVELVGVSEATERAHRGAIKMPYVPSGVEPPVEGRSLQTSFPIPVDLDYQISVWTRYAQQERAITSALTSDPTRFPLRFGYLEIPEDKTIRRLDSLGIVKADTHDEHGKRVFRTILNARVSSELLADVIRRAAPVLGVAITLKYGSGYQREESFGT
jgi:hypothetical protein